MCRPIAIFLLGAFLWMHLASPTAIARVNRPATSHNEQRNDLQDTYSEYRAKHPSFFSNTPIFHIIPERDLITLSVDSNLLDTTVVPANNQIANGDRRELQLEGWQTAALASFSAKSFGVGFSAELGEKSSAFESVNSGDLTQQQSETKFSGLGLYLYYMPDVRVVPKYININLILGYRKLNVLHRYSGLKYNDPTSELQPFRYDLSTFDYGSNISILLAKHFTVIPWINWRRTMPGRPEASSVNNIDIGNESELSNFKADRELLWQSEPDLAYGLDFAVKLGPINLHLGGLFGLIANFSKGSEQIQERGYSASIAYSFKSR